MAGNPGLGLEFVGRLGGKLGYWGWSSWLVPVRLVLLLFIMIFVHMIFLEIPGWIGLPVSALAVLALVYQGLFLNSVPDEDTSEGETSTDNISSGIIEKPGPADPDHGQALIEPLHSLTE